MNSVLRTAKRILELPEDDRLGLIARRWEPVDLTTTELKVLARSYVEGQWVPVGERLPDEREGNVEVTLPDETIQIWCFATMIDGTRFWEDVYGDEQTVCPIAWKRLPAPYQRTENNSGEEKI